MSEFQDVTQLNDTNIALCEKMRAFPIINSKVKWSMCFSSVKK